MQFKIIVAVCKNNGIGKNDTLPWSIREDLRHFSKITKGNGNNAIVMGKNTWVSIGSKCLPKRDNLILSRTLKDDMTNGAKVFESIDSLKSWCKEKAYEEIWIIGGESIYRQFVNEPETRGAIVTKLDQEFDCDTYFPELSLEKWRETEKQLMDTTQEFDVYICNYESIR